MSNKTQKFIPLFKKKYFEEIRESLKKEFNFTNEFAVPKLEKIIFNIGLGSTIPTKQGSDILENITGRKCVVTRARDSVAAYKIREGDENGVKVTCRADWMYINLERLMVGLLNSPKFKALKSKSVNCRGGKSQITIGIEDSTVFQGVNAVGVTKNIGLSVTIVSNARRAEHFISLLKGFEFPFDDKKNTVQEVAHVR